MEHSKTNMPDSTEKLEIITKIVNTHIFADSSSYQKILNYLLECSEKNFIPTEIDIATHVFQKDKTFNPSQDPFVRVYISKLRKKLDAYYEGSGKKEKLRITIPKGRYRIEFNPTSNTNSIDKNKILKLFQKKWTVLLLFLALIVIIGQHLNFASQHEFIHIYTEFQQNHPIWQPLLAENAELIYTFEDVYTFYEFDPALKRNRLIKDGAIRNDENLRRYQSEFKKEIKRPNWNAIPEISAIGLKMLAPIFLVSDTPYKVMRTSQLTWDDINNKNIIYAGQYQNMQKLGEFFPQEINILREESDELSDAQLSIQIDGQEHRYTYNPPEWNKKMTTIDYVTLALVPGPRDHKILFIASYHTVGRKEILSIITESHREAYAEFYSQFDQLAKTTPYFLMLVQVDGYEKTSIKNKILHFLPLQ